MKAYTPPSWYRDVAIPAPTHRLELAMKHTPVQEFQIPGVPNGFVMSVKRDDMTGSTLSGNKVRKLEFLLADARLQGATDVITSGSTQSNHARATLIAAKQTGMKCHLVLRDLQENCRTEIPSGNFLMMQITEPDIHLLPWNDFSDETVVATERAIAKRIESNQGRKAYVIPPGGDTPIGYFGYLDAWEELIQQGVIDRFDDVVVPTGTTGTVFGVALGNLLTGSKVRIHAMSVSRKKENIDKLIRARLMQFGLGNTKTEDFVDVIDTHIGLGYNKYEEKDMEFIKNIATATGLYCDPVYVGKALRGTIIELQDNPRRFKGKRILFIHTGGLFAMFETRAAKIISGKTKTSRIQEWRNGTSD